LLFVGLAAGTCWAFCTRRSNSSPTLPRKFKPRWMPIASSGWVSAEPACLPPRSTYAVRRGDASLGEPVGGGANGGRAASTRFRAFEDVGCQADLVAASAAICVQACEDAVDFHLHLDVSGQRGQVRTQPHLSQFTSWRGERAGPNLEEVESQELVWSPPSSPLPRRVLSLFSSQSRGNRQILSLCLW